MQDLTRIPTTAQLRALESAWIRACHRNWGTVLMECAGLNAAQVAMDLLDGTARGVAIVCGRGNNGGDGLVVARYLHQHEVPVHVYMIGGDKEPDAESESGINKRILRDCVGLPIHYLDGRSLDRLQDKLADCDLVIDALLGTGLDRAAEGIYAETIEVINNSGVTVLAIDLPSGIQSDTGQVMGTAVEADATVTFGYLKAGLLHYPGAEYAGVVSLIDIGLPDINILPPVLHDMTGQLKSPSWWLATHEFVRECLPMRRPDGHKGTFGRVLAIAGSRDMTGSAMLASRTVLRAGAGYVVLATAETVIDRLPPEEIVYRSLHGTKSGTIDASAFDQLSDDLTQADAVLIGPGLGGDDGTVKLVEKLLASLTVPCIIDADGLNAMAKLKTVKFKNPAEVILTPHPKELERLTGTPVVKIQADRIAAAEAACKQFGCNIILKGARTVVATPDYGTYIIPTGNSGMATPGAGDVLSGIVGAFLALRMPAPQAAIVAAYVHGAAGDLAADRLGEDGMVAHDIMDCLPPILAEIRDGNYTGRLIEGEVL
jgi:ADP-dependent NAD(P)H-hydrate dehydratase / NAD(P)H-hydrate epimerase